MNCPDCGTPITAEQQFCRACGTPLDGSEQAVTRPSAVTSSQQIRLIGFISVFLGLAVALTGRMLFHSELVVYIGVLMNFLGMFLVIYPSLMPHSHRPKTARAGFRPATLPAANVTRKLTPMDDSFVVPSVTESTTNLRKTPVPGRNGPERPLP